MADASLSILITGQYAAMTAFRQAERDMRSLGLNMIDMGVSATRLASDFDGAMTSIVRSAARMGVAVADSLMTIGAVATGVAVTVSASILKQAADFQTYTNLLQTQAGELPANMGQITKGILDMTNQVGYSANQLAQAEYYVESAGVHGKDALTLLQAGAMAAQVGHADLTETIKAETSIMSVYGDSVDAAAGRMGQLITGIGLGKLTMQEFNASFGTIGSTLAAAGVPFEQYLAMLDANTIQGLQASRANTTLRFGIESIVAPSTKAGKILAELGINYHQFATEVLDKGPIVALGELQQKIDALGLDAATKQEIFKGIFGGVRGEVGLDTILEQYGFITKAAEKIGDVTKAQETFTADWAKKTQEANFQWQALQGAVSNIAVQMGTEVLPQITPIIAAFAQDLPNAFNIVKDDLFSFGSAFVSVLSTLAQDAVQFISIVFTALQTINPFSDTSGSSKLVDDVTLGTDAMKKAFGGLIDVTPVLDAIHNSAGELNVSLQDLTEEGLAGLGKTDPVRTLDKALKDMVDSAKQNIQDLRDQLSGLQSDLNDALRAPLPGEIPAQIDMQKSKDQLLQAQAVLADAKANALHVPSQTPGPSGHPSSSAEAHVAFARSVGGRSGSPNENPAVKAAQATVDRLQADVDRKRAHFDANYTSQNEMDQLLAKQATTPPVTQQDKLDKIAKDGPKIRSLLQDIADKEAALHKIEGALKGVGDMISAAGGAAKDAKGPIDLVTGAANDFAGGIKAGTGALDEWVKKANQFNSLFQDTVTSVGDRQQGDPIQTVSKRSDANQWIDRINQGAADFKKKLEGWTTELNTNVKPALDRVMQVLTGGGAVAGPPAPGQPGFVTPGGVVAGPPAPGEPGFKGVPPGLGGLIELGLDKSLDAVPDWAAKNTAKIANAMDTLGAALGKALATAIGNELSKNWSNPGFWKAILTGGAVTAVTGSPVLGAGAGLLTSGGDKDPNKAPGIAEWLPLLATLGLARKLGLPIGRPIAAAKNFLFPNGTPPATPETPTGAPTEAETPDVTDAVTKISSETGMPEDQIAWWRGGAQAAEPGATAAAPEAAEAAPGLLGGLGKALGPAGVVIGAILQAKSIWDTVQNMGQNKTNPNARFNIPGIDQPLTSDQVKSWFSSPSKTTPSGTLPPSPTPGTFVQTGPGGQGGTVLGPPVPGQNAVSVPGLNNIKVPNELGDNLSTQIATDLTTSLPDAVQKADPGTALATGFTTSIISAANEILNGAMTFFKQFSDGLTGASAFDTGSPSKWSANVAQDVVDGFSQGIDDHVSDVDPSIQKFLDEIKKQIGSLKDKDAKKMGLDLLDSIVKGLSSPTDTSKIQDEGKSLADSFSTGFLAEVQNRLAQADLHVDVQTKPQPTVSTHDTSGVDQLTAGPRQSFASGGSINAALGEPVLAMVHGGETVLNPKQTALLAPHLARANVPGFAEGGLVGNIPVTGSPSTGGDVPVTVGPTAYSVVISDADLVKLINKAKAGNLMPGGWKPSEVVDILDLLEGTPLPGSSTSGELGDALAALEEDYTGNALAGDPSLSPEDFIQKTQAQWANLALWMQMNAASAPWKPAAGPVPKVPVVLSGLGTLRDNWVMDSNSVKKGLLPADQAIPGPQGWNSEEVSKVLTNLSLNSNKLESDTPTPNTGELAIALSHFAENAHSFGALSNVDKTIPEWVNFVLWLQDNDVAPSGPVSVTSDPDIKYDAFQSWRASLTSAEKKAVGDYIGNSKNLNRFLRGGRPRPNLAVPESALDQMMQGEQDPARLQQQADNIIAALKRSKITEPLRVYRGFTDRYLDKPLEVGENFVDPGFVSTSLDSAMAENFAGDYRDAESANRYIAEIDIPAGATGAYINPDEEEVLLPAGGSFDVTNIGKPYDRGRYVFTPIMMQYTPGAHGATPVTPPAGRGGFTGLPDWEGPLDEGFSALQKLPTSTGFSGLPDWMSGKSGGFSGLPKLPTSMGFTGLPGFAQPGAPNLEAFEQGGFISGSGPRPVIAHGGEYVLSQDVVKAILHGNGGTAPSNDTATERTGGASFHFHAPLIGQATLGSQMDIEQTATALVEGMRRSADSVWRHSAVVPITSRPKV